MPQFLEHFPSPLLEDILYGRCLPFVGAGFSMNAEVPSGLTVPDWDGLGRDVAKALRDYQYTSALEALSAYCHEYSRAKLVERISQSLLVDKVSPGAAHRAFCRLPFEKVVTTNFDFLLEQGYLALRRYCLPLIAEDQLSVGSDRAGVRLLKLHGDLHHPNRLVATEEDYDSFLARYPLLATHLSSLLIENTALFVGYSLDDPDFRQVAQVVKDRLGELRRPAYVLQVAAPSHVVSRYERRGVKVINLPKLEGFSFGQTLEQTFRELLNFWTDQLISRSTSTETEPQAELALPMDAHGRMCFFSVPTRFAAFYKTVVYPIAERHGFSPIMAADVIAPGDSIMAKTFALVEKAGVIVVDTGSQNTLFELGMTQSRVQGRPPVLVITDKAATLSLDLSEYQHIVRSGEPGENDEPFISALERTFSELAEQLGPALADEPRRLLNKKEYRASVISAFTVLEHELRSRLYDLPEQFVHRLSMGRMLKFAFEHELLTGVDEHSLRRSLSIRNELVHSRGDIAPKTARHIVSEVEAVCKALRVAQVVDA